MFFYTYNFIKTYCVYDENYCGLTLNSNAPTAMPEAAPVPERPMKCSLPILLAKRDAPT